MKEVLAEKLSRLGSPEEKYNSAREFLQELVLQILDRRGYFSSLAFVGGTALRLLYDLPRFSEDLDFSLINPAEFSFDRLWTELRQDLKLNGFQVEIAADRKEKNVLGEFLRFPGLLFDLGLTAHQKEKLFIKLEVDSNPPAGYAVETTLINKNFFFKVQNYDLSSLFASKLHAFLFRKYNKGRDYYDLLWFLSRKTPVNYPLLSAAADQTEKGEHHFTPEKLRVSLLDKIDRTDFRQIVNDAVLFLNNKTEMKYFQKDYFVKAVEKGLLP